MGMEREGEGGRGREREGEVGKEVKRKASAKSSINITVNDSQKS